MSKSEANPNDQSPKQSAARWLVIRRGGSRCCFVGAFVLALAAGGCDPAGSGEGLSAQLDKAKRENVKLREQAAGLQQDLKARDEHIVRLQGLGGKRMALLFTVAKIKLGRTSGVNLDQAPGDDGVRVYLKTIDRDGHAVKAAGDVTVQLFDLAAGAPRNLLERHDFPAADAAKHFSGGFLMNQYRFDCPFKSGPPKRPELTVRVTFTDYLTGQTFTAQKVIDLALPAATTQPK